MAEGPSPRGHSTVPTICWVSIALFPATLLGGAAARSPAPVPAVRIETGTIGAASFALARPASWNGSLLLVVPGFRPVDAPLQATLDVEQFHYRTLLEQGWMIATSSLRRNGVIVADGIADIDALRTHLARTFGHPRRVVLAGDDLGGLIAVFMAERDPAWDSRGLPEYAGAIAVGAALGLREPGAPAALSLRPKMPLLFLSNQNEIDGPLRYVTSPVVTAGSNVPPALFRIARDGHLNVSPRERLAAIRAMESWLDRGAAAVPQPAAGQRFFDATLLVEPAAPRATLLPDGRGFAARVLQVTSVHGNIEIEAALSDFAAVGIVPMSWFQLKLGERTQRTRYGRDFGSVERGEWVAFANADGTTWIGRNLVNTGVAATLRAGDTIVVQRY